MDAPFVAAPPTGARVRTSVHVTDTEHSVLVELGSYLGSLASKDLAARCAAGAGKKHLGRAERKKALTPLCSSRWAGAITRRSDDMWQRQKLNYQDELASKQAAVKAIEKRITKPVAGKGGYPTKQVRFAKQKRLQVLKRRVVWLSNRLETGRVKVVRGSSVLLNNRHNLEAAGLTVEQWRARWDASRWFLTADGDKDYQYGNGLIEVSPDTGEMIVTLPTPLKHLANAPRGRFKLATTIEFNHRAGEWAAQAMTGAVAYKLNFNADKHRWYLDASWKIGDVELPSLEQLRGMKTLGVDLNGDHLAAWVVTADGNPQGDPITLSYDSTGRSTRNQASLLHAITKLLRVATSAGCASISVENLNFQDARDTGREHMGHGKRGKRFRKTVAGMPTAQFRDRLAAMAHNTGIAITVVDPAYTSIWGRQYWHQPLQHSRRTQCSSHHAAAVVIGRRALGLTAKRQTPTKGTRDGTTGTRQRTRTQTKVCVSRSNTSKRRGQTKSTTLPEQGNPLNEAPQRREANTGSGDAETLTRQPNTNGSQGATTVQDARPADTHLLPTE